MNLKLQKGCVIILNTGEILTAYKVTSHSVTFEDPEGRRGSISVNKLTKGLGTWKYKDSKKYDLQINPTRFRSPFNGFYNVLELDYVNNEALIKFDNSYNRKSVSIFSALNGLVEDRIVNPEHAEGYYVYAAYYNDNIYYIGQGKDLRYMHVNSGTSHSYDLNWHHFNNYDFEIRILRDQMTQEESLDLEDELIKRYQPRCNRRGK